MVIKHEITTEVKQHAEDRGCLTPQAGTTGRALLYQTKGLYTSSEKRACNSQSNYTDISGTKK